MKWFKDICSAFVQQQRTVQKIQENKKSSQQFGWKPKWFGATDFNAELIDKIKEFQLKYVYDLDPTGVVDTLTYRRQMTEREGLKEVIKEYAKRNHLSTIICNGKRVKIAWKKIVTFKDPSGFSLPKENYKTVTTERKPNMFMAHWDVCLSSKSCFNVLKKRGISVHFCIDNDGTIYQLMDCNHIAWHAGNRKVNNNSIGVEISNAYYPKYQELYKMKGFGERPVWKDVKVHGKTLEPFLGFYPVQAEAFKALAEALNKEYGIPLVTPTENNELIETIYTEAQRGTFEGVVSHYHITRRKIDCAGFKLNEVLK